MVNVMAEENTQGELIKVEKTSFVNPLKCLWTIVIDMFTDWQDFASTPLGLLFTVGMVIIGAVIFIALSQFNMTFIGGLVVGGAVFGDIALGLIAGKLHKHGFFRGCCVASSDALEETNPYLQHPQKV